MIVLVNTKSAFGGKIELSHNKKTPDVAKNTTIRINAFKMVALTVVILRCSAFNTMSNIVQATIAAKSKCNI